MKHLFWALPLFLSACSFQPEVIEKPVLVEKTPLIAPSIRPATQTEFEWFVITKDNIDSVIKEHGSVFFALTPEGYQALAMNEAELRRYIEQQNQVVGAYKEYYKPRE